MVKAYIFNPSTQKVEAGGSLWAFGQPGLWNELQDQLGLHSETMSQKNGEKKKEKWKGGKYITNKRLEISMGEWSYEDSGPSMFIIFQKAYECQAYDPTSHSEHKQFMDGVSELQWLS